MNGIDSSTWQALGLVLTAIGLLLSVVAWRRRGPASGLRGVAWSLLPAAAGLTGTLRLLWEIGDAVGSWAVRLVFSPIVWAGIVLAGVSLVLFGVSGAMKGRGVGTKPRAAGAGRDDKALPDGRSSRRSSPKSSPKSSTRSSPRAEPAVQDKDMDDIEAILRKHGIQ